MTVETLNTLLRRLPAWPLYVIGAVPVLWLYWSGITNRLGVEPVQTIEHRLGLWGMWLMLATLAVSPLRRHLGLNLMRFRRALGMLSFYYIFVHMLTWAILDVQTLSAVGADLLKRPYITIGMTGLILLLPLAATSTNWAIRQLEAPRWRQLHTLVYPAVLCGAVHFVMLRKGWQAEPLIYLFIVVVLLVLRLSPRRAPRLN